MRSRGGEPRERETLDVRRKGGKTRRQAAGFRRQEAGNSKPKPLHHRGRRGWPRRENHNLFMGKTKSYLIHRFTQISTDKIGIFVIMKSVAMDFAFRFPLPFTVDRLPFTHLFLVPQTRRPGRGTASIGQGRRQCHLLGHQWGITASGVAEAGEDGGVEVLKVLEVAGQDGLEDIQVESLVVVDGYVAESSHLLHL